MKKLLVICDDVWHPAEIIEQGFSYIQSEEIQFDFVRTAKDILTEEMLAEYPIVFCCKGNSINAANQEPWFEEGVTEVGPKEIERYIENGGVYVVLHAGSAVHPDWFAAPGREKFHRPAEEYTRMIGCRFITHPPRCPVTVSVTNPEHPLMEGVEDFTERDEHYQLEVTEPYITTLFETSSESGGVGRPGGFLFVKGKGRVVVITPGHTLSVWKNPNFQRILTNIIHYYTDEPLA